MMKRCGGGGRWTASAAALGLSLVGPACTPDYRDCDPVAPEMLALVPDRLSETGLYADMTTGALEPDVVPFTPQFPLWTDGAAKRRWIYLPPGSSIDTHDMDFWQFPEGTKLWKEFTRDGIRIETRLLQKVGPAPEDWVAVAYAWNSSQSDAMMIVEGEEDAHGTGHDIPAAADCMGCHGGTSSRVLGFSAIQLSYDAPEDQLDLSDLIAGGLLSAPPAGDLVVPGNDLERRSLGYLHANCGHCHNDARPETTGARCYDPEREFYFLLRAGELETVEATAVYRTVVGGLIQPGQPENSYVIELISGRPRILGQTWFMPPLGTELVDEEAVEMLTAWIDEM